MTVDAAAVASRRFGLGPRPGDRARIAADPLGYVLAGIADRGAARLERPGLGSTPQIFAAVAEARFQTDLLRALKKNDEMAGSAQAGAPPASSDMGRTAEMRPNAGSTSTATAGPAAAAPPALIDLKRPRDFYIEDAIARFETMTSTPAPLVERLVSFWSNHFAVSALKGPFLRAGAGAFEREAIRPHVLGRFADMLRAVEQHPAMLIYLDNQLSVGPASPAGRNRRRGLNENLAREILELHTLGVDGGYSQTDVTNLARIITGWTVSGTGRLGGLGAGQGAQDKVEPGSFIFAANRHEPGRHPLLGTTYGETGRRAGEQALEDLARHPATARHVAFKLAAHFVSQKPPPQLVAALATTFRQSDGDLQAVTRTLVTSQEAWSTPMRKVAPPCDFAVSLVRGLDVKPRSQELLRLASLLGQPLWQVQSPKGWTDEDDAWMGPAAVRERLRAAERFAREIADRRDPRDVADDLFGPALSQPSRLAIERAESRPQAFELLIMTPEFQRR